MDKVVLYRSQEEHCAASQRFPFKDIPCRVFLDTNIINCLIKWSHCVFEHEAPPTGIDETLQTDIVSLMHVFYVGSYAMWDIVTSERAIEEISRTRNQDLRAELLEYGLNLLNALDEKDDDGRYARDLVRRLRDSPFVAGLPDANDRELVSQAVALQCDAFCTRDRRTIYSKKDTLRALPLKVLTPSGWWDQVKPWAGLWC